MYGVVSALTKVLRDGDFLDIDIVSLRSRGQYWMMGDQ